MRHVARHCWARRRSGAVSPDAGGRAAGEHVSVRGSAGRWQAAVCALSWLMRCCARKRRRQRWSRAASANRAGCLRPAIIRTWKLLGCRRTSRRCRSSCSSATTSIATRKGLCHRIGLRPFFGRRKVAIVDDADHFSIPSANCLLKTLEEPPPSALLILIGTSPEPAVADDSIAVASRAISAA